MAIITSIKQQKNKNRVNVYLDNKFGFGIDLDNFVILKLMVGKELAEEEVAEVVKKSEFQSTLDKLYRFCMVRPRSLKEVNDWFKRKLVHTSLQPKLLEKIKHLDLLDDTKFAAWWVEQRTQFKKKSKRVIKMELQQKGIDKNTIEDVLGGVEIDEEKMAKEVLTKKAYKWQGLPKEIAKQKMSQYLAGKGFSWDVIEKVLPGR